MTNYHENTGCAETHRYRLISVVHLSTSQPPLHPPLETLAGLAFDRDRSVICGLAAAAAARWFSEQHTVY